MDTSIIISIIFGVTSIISSIFLGFIPTIRRNKLSNLEEKNSKLLNDIMLFYEIEDELLERLHKNTGISKDTLKKEIRRIISDNNDGKKLSDYSKPSVHKKLLNN